MGNDDEITEIRINNHVMNSHIDTDIEKATDFYRAVKLYFTLLYENSIQHKLQAGESIYQIFLGKPSKKLSGPNKRPTLLKMEAESLRSRTASAEETKFNVMIFDGQASTRRQYAATVADTLSHV